MGKGGCFASEGCPSSWAAQSCAFWGKTSLATGWVGTDRAGQPGPGAVWQICAPSLPVWAMSSEKHREKEVGGPGYFEELEGFEQGWGEKKHQ